MLPGSRGPRRVAPVRWRGPLSLDLASEPATPPGVAEPGGGVDIGALHMSTAGRQTL
jgi:hypothetical protein